jgi:glutamate-ammonia-ligase adenylyltransferase
MAALTHSKKVDNLDRRSSSRKGRARPPAAEAALSESPSSFRDPADGQEARWRQTVRAVLARCPDPEQAAGLVDGLMAAEGGEGAGSLSARLAGSDDAELHKLGQIVRAVCGVAPFLGAHVRRHPSWLQALLDEDLLAARSDEELKERLRALRGRDPEAPPERILREFKYYELARITIRDTAEDLVPLDESAIIFQELSTLADVVLAEALAVAAERLTRQLGPPRWRSQAGDDVELGFCVLGLGKLGSEELNYSSDVDLIYVHQAPPAPLEHAGGGNKEQYAQLSPLDYFSRLAQGLGKIATPVTAEGFLYRIDLDLRPEGAQGTLVTSDEALATYYEAWADTWERAAFMKARPVAGDLALGWRSIRQVDPMIFHSTMDYGAVESIRSLKQKVEERHGNHVRGFNVKIDAGGIRDVEFIAQSLQLLHGGRIPQVRERSTQRALRNLAEVGILDLDDVDGLLRDYRFLRRTENRLQMEGERQTHVVPVDDDARARLARAMDFVDDEEKGSADEQFSATLEAHSAHILSLSGATAETCEERILELYARNIPRLLAQPGMKPMIETLAGRFARCIDGSPDPERALNNLDRFIQGVGSDRFYYELLIDRPELVERMTTLFAASRYLSGFLASHPRLIEPVFADPNVLLLSRDELAADLAKTEAVIGESIEESLDALRIFQHRQMLNVGLLDLGGKIDRPAAETGLTEIAEVCLERALELARVQLEGSRDGVPDAARRGDYLIVGMGKLGSRELTYGSDLDLIFLYDLQEQDNEAAPIAQHYFVRLTQRLISGLQTPTGEGFCYEIDARLRPSGNQGTLVTSRAAFERYHEEDAEIWERQALLRARPVAGSSALAEKFDRIRSGILKKPLPEDLAPRIDSVRQRMQDELAHETRERRNFKMGRGGLLDIETIVQYLLLRCGAEDGVDLGVDRLEPLLRGLAEAGRLATSDAETLLHGWDFLQNLGSRLRIVENRSISDLDSERGDLESLALRLGYESTGREGGARRALLRDYQHHTDAIRAVYEQVMRTE